MNEEMKARLIKLIADQAGCPPEIVKPDSNLVADLGMDSLDLIETCMAVEEEFEIEISDEEAERYVTVGDIMDLVVLKGGK
jgi:acyl carrier protein